MDKERSENTKKNRERENEKKNNCWNNGNSEK